MIFNSTVIYFKDCFNFSGMTLSLPQVQAYIGEVSVPKLRGIFGNLTQTTTIMGQFVMSGLTYLNDWDEAVFISGCFPVIAIIYLYFVSFYLLKEFLDNEAFYLQKLC